MNPLPTFHHLRSCLPWLAVLALVGCASYPMGLKKAQWESLSPAQQAEFRAQQHVIDEERARRYAAEEARRIQARQEAEERERVRIAEAYRHARYGDIITVTIRDGLLTFHGKRHPYEPVAFEIVRDETKPVVFRRQGQPHIATEIIMHLAEDGHTFYFDYPSRKRFVAVNDGWQRGHEYLPALAGGYDGQPAGVDIRITIRHRPLPLRLLKPTERQRE